LKASVAARLLHHQQRKERKNKSKDVLIPVEEDAQPLFERIWKAVAKYVGSDTSAAFKGIMYKAVGDAIAYKAREATQTITLQDMNRVMYLIRMQGIVIE
jgi:hypothetical protein